AQRVALARALATEPELLILDEPLSALDLHARPAIRRLLADVLADFKGVKLVITHDPLEAMALGDHLLILESGRLAQEGTPDEIRRRPRVEYAASLVGVNLFRGVVAVENERIFIDLELGGRLSVPADSLEPGAPVFATLHPHAIVLSGECPEGSSVRNTMPGKILGADAMGDRVRVHVGSTPPLTAEITPNAAAELHLVAGTPVWASFKATEIGVYPR
ncbi:MAG: TOBE domain-containing protein, partial [Phycisphaerales bacterium]|nr:TOBE domain-containing protein [Phycisphaerales bacterium]